MSQSDLPARLVRRFKVLRARREAHKDARRRALSRRSPLTAAERRRILRKTGGRCHICGGSVRERLWQADHVLSASRGGHHSEANYLAAHSTCNNYRWDYLPEEFQYILKLGVWARTQIETQTPLGRELAVRFASYERTRMRRRAPGPLSEAA